MPTPSARLPRLKALRSHPAVPPGQTPFLALAEGTPGLVAYWTFGEPSGATANDRQFRDDGVYTGGVTLAQTGLSAMEPTRTSALLNGTTGYISVGAPYIPALGDVFTVIIGLKRTATGGLAQRLYDRNPSGDLQIFVNGGTVDHWQIETQAGTTIAESTSTLDTNPHLIAWTKNAATNVQYQDGAVVTGAVTNATITGATGSLIIGQHRSLSGDFFNGTLQDYLLYNRALSAAEITALWNAWGSANVSANAQASTGAGAAQQPTIAIAPNAGNAAGTGAANQPTPAIAASAQAGTGTGAARQPNAALSVNAQAATGTGTANQPTAFGGISVNAQAATGTGAAQGASEAIAPNAGNAAGTGAARQPTGALNANAGNAAALGAALGPGIAIIAVAGVATATGAAQQPTVLTGTTAFAGLATGVFSAFNATVIATGTGGTGGGAYGYPQPQRHISPWAHVEERPLKTTVRASSRELVTASAGVAHGTGSAHEASTSWNDDESVLEWMLDLKER